MNVPFVYQKITNCSIMQKLLIVFFLALGTGTFAQQFPYQFNYSNEPYSPLSNATEMDEGVWEEGTFFPLGFDFQFAGQTMNRMVLEAYSAALIPEYSYFLSDSTDAILGYTVSYGFLPIANTVIRYQTDGVAPNRIAKLEFYRAGLDNNVGEVTFQIWLFETSNAFQIRLGEQSITDPSEAFFNKVSPLIGFMVGYHYLNNTESIFPQAQFVVGSPSMPTDSIIINGTLDESMFNGPQYGQTGLPLLNSVFTFTPGNISAAQQAHLSPIRLSPNPALDVVRIEGIATTESVQVQILNEQGRLIANLEMPAGEQILNLPENMPPGLYLLRCTHTGNRQSTTLKLIKI